MPIGLKGFQPGNTKTAEWGKLGGRPKGAKNTLPIIRDKLFRILLRRITREKDLETVDTATLIKFASACLPKDMTLAVQRPAEINYISNVPRPEVDNECVPIISHDDNGNNLVVEEGKVTQAIDVAQFIENISSEP
jgi:hypothetical protein